MPAISLCMIVKNEEAVLARCLDSMSGCVDEIIIADTGSTDSTKEIASRYTDKIFDYKWINDFSAARNFAFSKANCDFVMWMDADDVLTSDDKKAFLELKNSIPDTADVVMMKYNTGFDEDGRPVYSYYRERIIRRNIDFCWKGRVHEAIVHNGRVMYSDVALTHKSVKAGYSDRNLRIYEMQEAEGEAFTPRDSFYYGRELYYHRHYVRAEEILAPLIEAGRGWNENLIEACKILSYCYTEQACGIKSSDSAAVEGADIDTSHTEQGYRQLMSKALGILTESFRFDMPRAEICCDIGNIFMQLNNYRLASFWFELALKLPCDLTGGGFYSADCHGFIPCIQLCVCYDRMGDINKAEKYNAMAGGYRPHSPAYLQNLEYFSEYHKRLKKEY